MIVIIYCGTGDPAPAVPTLQELKQEFIREIKAVEPEESETEVVETQFVHPREEKGKRVCLPLKNPQQICGRYPSGFV